MKVSQTELFINAKRQAWSDVTEARKRLENIQEAFDIHPTRERLEVLTNTARNLMRSWELYQDFVEIESEERGDKR